MVDRKCTEALPGPFPNFLGGAWGQGYCEISFVFSCLPTYMSLADYKGTQEEPWALK